MHRCWLWPWLKCDIRYDGWIQVVDYLVFLHRVSNQTYETEPTKTNLPKQTYQTEPTKLNLQKLTYFKKPTKPNKPNQSLVRQSLPWAWHSSAPACLKYSCVVKRRTTLLHYSWWHQDQDTNPKMKMTQKRKATFDGRQPLTEDDLWRKKAYKVSQQFIPCLLGVPQR